jgi:hypothetical protein
MVNKTRLYWTLQICGWTTYAAVQIVTYVLASGTSGVATSIKRPLSFVFEAILCLLVTH